MPNILLRFYIVFDTEMLFALLGVLVGRCRFDTFRRFCRFRYCLRSFIRASCSCCEHITNSVIGVSRPSVLRNQMTPLIFDPRVVLFRNILTPCHSVSKQNDCPKQNAPYIMPQCKSKHHSERTQSQWFPVEWSRQMALQSGCSSSQLQLARNLIHANVVTEKTPKISVFYK